jgi:hypothetical protein
LDHLVFNVELPEFRLIHGRPHDDRTEEHTERSPNADSGNHGRVCPAS